MHARTLDPPSLPPIALTSRATPLETDSDSAGGTPLERWLPVALGALWCVLLAGLVAQTIAIARNASDAGVCRADTRPDPVSARRGESRLP